MENLKKSHFVILNKVVNDNFLLSLTKVSSFISFIWEMINSFPCFSFRPGFVRVSLPYFMNDKTVDFVLNAINMVATHGWKLLPQVSEKTCLEGNRAQGMVIELK